MNDRVLCGIQYTYESIPTTFSFIIGDDVCFENLAELLEKAGQLIVSRVVWKTADKNVRVFRVSWVHHSNVRPPGNVWRQSHCLVFRVTLIPIYGVLPR